MAVVKSTQGEGEIKMGQPQRSVFNFILETVGALDGIAHLYLHFRKKLLQLN